jgi:hypothetical protein
MEEQSPIAVLWQTAMKGMVSLLHVNAYAAVRGQYSVHREEEVDLRNRTDIRLWHPRDLVSTIEVKFANKVEL